METAKGMDSALCGCLRCLRRACARRRRKGCGSPFSCFGFVVAVLVTWVVAQFEVRCGCRLFWVVYLRLRPTGLHQPSASPRPKLRWGPPALLAPA